MQALRLGHFRLGTLLGAGGMGRVWRAGYEGPGFQALPPELRRDVALKVMTVEAAREPAWRDSFATEIRAVARLDHPFIPAIYDFGEVTEAQAETAEGELVALLLTAARRCSTHQPITLNLREAATRVDVDAPR